MKLVYLPCPRCGVKVRFELPTVGEVLASIAKWHKEEPTDEAAKDSLESVFDDLRDGKDLDDFDYFLFGATPNTCKKCGMFFAPHDIKRQKQEGAETVKIPQAPKEAGK